MDRRDDCGKETKVSVGRVHNANYFLTKQKSMHPLSYFPLKKNETATLADIDMRNSKQGYLSAPEQILRANSVQVQTI